MLLSLWMFILFILPQCYAESVWDYTNQFDCDFCTLSIPDHTHTTTEQHQRRSLQHHTDTTSTSHNTSNTYPHTTRHSHHSGSSYHIGPIVDVFMIITNSSNHDNNLIYLQDNNYITAIALIHKYTRMTHIGADVFPDTRLHIFTDNNRVIRDLQQLAYIGLYIYDMNTFMSLHDTFLHTKYRYKSALHTKEIDIIGMYRWLLYTEGINRFHTEYPHTHKIHRIVTVDIDIFILQNINELYNSYFSIMSNKYNIPITDIEVVIVYPAALHLWTLRGLQLYVEYMNTWYTNVDNDDDMNVKVKQYGEYINKQLHFNDQHMIASFATNNIKARALCPIRTTMTPRNKKREGMKCLIEQLKYIPVGNLREFVEINDYKFEFNLTTMTITGIGEPYPYSFIVSTCKYVMCPNVD